MEKRDDLEEIVREQTQEREKKGGPTSLTETPSIPGTMIGVLYAGYQNMDRIMMAALGHPEFLAANISLIVVSSAVYSIIATETIRPLGKFAGESKIRSWIKSAKLEHALKHTEPGTEMSEKVQKELRSCFNENSSFFDLIMSGYHMEKDDIPGSISYLSRYFRTSKRDDKGSSFLPIREASGITLFAYYSMKDELGALLNKNHDSKRAKYETLVNTYIYSKSPVFADIVFNSLKKQGLDLDDAVAHANIKSALNERNENGYPDDSWKPLVDIIEKKASGGLSDHVERKTDSRNDVMRLDDVFLKRYDTEEKRKTEIENISHFSKLDHVISNFTTHEIDGEPYMITPFSGETLYNLAKNHERISVENALEEAIRNLSEIHKIGRQLEYPSAGKEDYLQRAKRAFESLGMPEDLIRQWNSLLIEPITRLDTSFYKDGNPKNVLVEDIFVSEIDFESNVERPPMIDLVSLAESPVLDYHENMLSLLGMYCDAMGGSIQDFPTGIELELCRAQRHLEMAAYRKRDLDRNPENHQEYIKERDFHISRLLDSMHMLESQMNEDGYRHISDQIELSYFNSC